MTSSTQPVRIGRRDPGKVVIEWEDGCKVTYSAAELRRLCPCAQCIHELTGEPLLDPESVPDGLSQQNLRLVGSYGIAMEFSDGHTTGIYTYEALRRGNPGNG